MPELEDLATPWALRVAVTLHIPELMADGASDVQDLASRAQCDPSSLERILRHLAQHGVFEEPVPGVFALNAAAQALCDPAARLGLDLDGIGGRMAYVWSTLLSAVRTGRPAYQEVFGRPFWEDLDANPRVADSFDALMGPAGHGTPDPEILLDGEWPSVHVVVDVGGGTGALINAIVKAHPSVHGILVDLPRTIAQAQVDSERVTLAAQSFFEPLPTGGDVYVLKNVLADWPDQEAETLLRRCAEAARPDGRVVMLGGVSTQPSAGPELLMLVLVGGKSRTLEEFRALASRAGLTVTRSGDLPSGRFAVECRPI